MRGATLYFCRGAQQLLVVVILALLLRAAPAVGTVLFNVGLPRTGTTSIHTLVPLFNFSSMHIVFDRLRFDVELQLDTLLEEFRKTGQGPVRDLLEKFDVVGDTPCFGLIPHIKQFFPDAAVVATSRSKESWLGSMRRNPGAGGAFLVQQSQLLGADFNASTAKRGETRSRIYDTHAALLDKYNIPRIDLAASDSEKIGILLDSLPATPAIAVAKKCLARGKLSWPRKNSGQMGLTGASKFFPHMSAKKLQELSESCNFDFDNAIVGTRVEYPTDRYPGTHHTYVIKDE